MADSPLFGDNAVYFGKARKSHVLCQSRGQAELVIRMAYLVFSASVAN